MGFTIPPFVRFPPLREGNRARVRFPLRVGGNLKELIIPIARPKFTICPPSLRVPPLREGNRRVLVPPACRGNLKEGLSTAVFCELWLGDWYKGTSLEFTVCEARTLFRPHPQPLSHCVGEGRRGARRCALQRVPPLPQAGEGDKGGEGNTAHLPVRACAGKNSPCFKDFVPNRCTLTRP